MSDTATTDRLEGTARDGVPLSLTPAAVDAVLGDFRTWLLQLASGPHETADNGDDHHVHATRGSEVDLFTLISQFTALRHEVNMQTRAVRAAVEQIGAPKPPEDDER